MADTGVVETLLQRIEKADDGVDSLEVAASLQVDHQVIVGAVKSLQALGDVSFLGWEVAEVRLSPSTLLIQCDWCNKDVKFKESISVSQNCWTDILINSASCDMHGDYTFPWASQNEYLLLLSLNLYPYE